MKDIWFTSDSHFSHESVLKFTGDDGELIRPGFSSVEEMDELMLQNWNSVVKPGDKVYHLGDVVMKMEAVHNILPHLNGSKRLVLGNHDAPFLQHMMKYFKKVMLWRIFKDEGFVCSHIPLMPSQFRHKVTHNLFGHIHQNEMDDPVMYMNVCVEKTNYTPIHMDQVLYRIKNGLSNWKQ